MYHPPANVQWTKAAYMNPEQIIAKTLQAKKVILSAAAPESTLTEIAADATLITIVKFKN